MPPQTRTTTTTSAMRKVLPETTSSGEKTFPWKLHILLETSASEGFEDIVSWQGTNAFKVHDPVRFEESIIERFFNHTQFKSFQRQLNIYGFARVRKGGEGKAATGSYIHPLLIRGSSDACSFMIRTKIKNRNHNKKPLQQQRSRVLPVPRGLDEFMNPSKRDPVQATPLRHDFSLAVRDTDSIAPVTPVISNRNCATIESADANRGAETIENGISSRAGSISIPFRQLGQQGHYYKRRRWLNIMDNEELGLETIFDHDTITAVVSNSKNNKRNKRSRRSSIASAISMDDFLYGLW